jgi:hypothetical protein
VSGDEPSPEPVLWRETNDLEKARWAQFIAERPANVRAIAQRFNPWTMYRLTSTGQRCMVIGFHELEEPSEKHPEGVSIYLYVEQPHTLPPEMTAKRVFGVRWREVVPWTAADGERPSEWAMPWDLNPP